MSSSGNQFEATWIVLVHAERNQEDIILKKLQNSVEDDLRELLGGSSYYLPNILVKVKRAEVNEEQGSEDALLYEISIEYHGMDRKKGSWQMITDLKID